MSRTSARCVDRSSCTQPSSVGSWSVMTVENSSERGVRASMRDGCAIHVGPSYAESAATESLDAPVYAPIAVTAPLSLFFDRVDWGRS